MPKRKSPAPPKWTRALRAYVKTYSNAVRDNVESIAESLASHENLKMVDEKHVDAAFSVLSDAGLRRRRWIDRPEAEAALGSFCIGFSFACPDVVSVFLPATWAPAVAQFLVFGSFVLGIVLFSHGTYRSRLPSPMQNSNTTALRTRRWAIILLIVILLTAAGLSIYARVFYQCENCGTEVSEEFAIPDAAPPIAP